MAPMNTDRPSFANAFEIRELLGISKAHLDALDRLRMRDGVILGCDNQAHCLFVDIPYLQSFFAEIVDRFLWTRTDQKINLLRRCWSTPIPDELIEDVRKLIDIRNRVVHQKGKLTPDVNRSHGIEWLSNSPLSADEARHMLRHHQIAEDFLSRFWLPGDTELKQGLSSDPST